MMLALCPSPRSRGWWRGGPGESVYRRVGVLGLCCLSFCLARTCHRIFGSAQLLSRFQTALPGPASSSAAAKGKKNFFNLQHGIFPVILNKFHLFVLGIQIRITSLAQMQIQSHKRNIDSNCNHITISHAIKCPGCRQSKMEHLKSCKRIHSPTNKTSLSGETQDKMLLRTLQGPSKWLLPFLMENA